MAKSGALAIAALAGIGVVAAVAVASAKEKDKVPSGYSGPAPGRRVIDPGDGEEYISPEERDYGMALEADFDYLNQQAGIGFSSGNPSTMRKVANNLSNYAWETDEGKAQGKAVAAELRMTADAIEYEQEMAAAARTEAGYG